MSSLALEKIAEIKRLREQGLGYNQIAKRIKVGKGTAYNHGKHIIDKTTQAKVSCTSFCQGKGVKCQRLPGHSGVHLSDETGKLIYWE